LFADKADKKKAGASAGDGATTGTTTAAGTGVDSSVVGVLSDYKEHHTDVTVHFNLDVVPGKMEGLLAGGLESKFKLVSKISTGGGGERERERDSVCERVCACE
jgi:hypothetical protein